MIDITPGANLLSCVRTTIKSRRVTRNFSDEPIPKEYLTEILEAARWAPNGGMRRLNLYIVIRDTHKLRKIRAASPGILSFPRAVIVICLDTSKITELSFNDSSQGSAYVDVGTAAENMLLAAVELGIGACPVMSFYKPAIQILLNLPLTYDPAMMILLGFPAIYKSSVQIHSRLPKLDEIVHWDYFGGKA